MIYFSQLLELLEAVNLFVMRHIADLALQSHKPKVGKPKKAFKAS
jgi:hypothetical protein